MAHITAYARDLRDGDEKAKASVRRKFERDKDELRELGIPVETVTFTINYGAEEAVGYRISQSDFYLPYLKILREEEGLERVGPAEETQTEPLLSADMELFNTQPDGSIEIRSELAADALWGLKVRG